MSKMTFIVTFNNFRILTYFVDYINYMYKVRLCLLITLDCDSLQPLSSQILFYIGITL